MSVDNQEQQRVYEAELKKLEQRESEKQTLYKRSVGNTLDIPAPRPTDEFIEKCVGRLKSNTELSTQARENAIKRIQQEEAKIQRRQDVKISMDAHNKRVTQRMD